MNDLFKKDIIIKISSVFIAILLWLYVMNVDNPFEPRRIPVPVKIVNKDMLEDNDLFMKNEGDIPATIEVTVSGRREVISMLSSSDFVVELDFSRVKSVEDKTLRINEPYLVSPKDATIEGYYPQIVKLDLERIQSGTFPVEIQTQGNPKENYKITGITINPDKMPMRELESRLKTISVVKGTVDVNGLSKNMESKVECKAYDKQGKEIKPLRTKLIADVKIEVGKEVPVVLDIKGKPAQDHIEIKRSVTPSKVLIKGPPELLAGITELKTEPVDINNIRDTVNTTGKIVLPDQIKLVDSNGEVTVNVVVEALQTKDFPVAKTEINLRNGVADDSLKYEILTENAVIKLKGRKFDLQNLNMLMLRPWVDVLGKEEGTHRLPVNITLQQGVSMLQGAEVEVRITKAQE